MCKEEVKNLWFNIKHYGTILNGLDQETEHGFYSYKLHSYNDILYVSIERNSELLALYDTVKDKWSVQG